MPPRFRQSYSYAYPNEKSYNQLAYSPGSGPGYGGRSLRHGYIFGYKPTTQTPATPITPAPGQTEPVGPPPSTYRQIDYQNSKMFQFNPPALALDVSMFPAEAPDVAASGGNAPNPAVGVATTKLTLYFDRALEIDRSKRGQGTEVWRDLGVQVDLFDLFKVMSGGDESIWAKGAVDAPAPDDPFRGQGTVRKGSLTDMTAMMLDAALTGSHLYFKQFAIVFSPNLAVHVMQLKSLAFGYLKFTKDLVPVTVQVDMGLEISNLGTKAYVTSGGTSGPSTTPPPGVNPNPNPTPAP